MQDKTVHPYEIRGPIKITCNSCGAENSAKAYCCTKCFKVMRPKAKAVFGIRSLGGGTKILIVAAVIAIFATIAFRSWISKIESRNETSFKATQQQIATDVEAPPAR